MVFVRLVTHTWLKPLGVASSAGLVFSFIGLPPSLGRRMASKLHGDGIDPVLNRKVIINEMMTEQERFLFFEKVYNLRIQRDSHVTDLCLTICPGNPLFRRTHLARPYAVCGVQMIAGPLRRLV